MEVETVDALVRRFHADRVRVGEAGRRDVAVAFVAPRLATNLQRQAVLDAFRSTASHRLFAPFDTHAVENENDCICYVLRSVKQNADNGFQPFFCTGGAAQRATVHYRVDFEALLRVLFERGYRYLMKPVVVDRCVTETRTSLTTSAPR